MTPETAVDLAIDNVILEGLDDVFARPPELDFLQDTAFRQVVTDTAKRALSGGLDSLAVGPIQHTNVPKSGMYAFRRCAIVQPMDHIKYLSLTLLAADEIEHREILQALGDAGVDQPDVRAHGVDRPRHTLNTSTNHRCTRA
jgi:hypothetical protein